MVSQWCDLLVIAVVTPRDAFTPSLSFATAAAFAETSTIVAGQSTSQRVSTCATKHAENITCDNTGRVCCVSSLSCDGATALPNPC